MASRLRQLLDLVEAGVTARMAVAAPAFTVAFDFGSRAIPDRAAIPRVQWIQRSYAWGPARKGAANPRRVATRRTRLDVHLHGDPEILEVLADCLYLALADLAQTSFEIDDAAWTTPDEQSARERLVIPLTLDVPVCEPADGDPLITATGFDNDTSPAVAGDGYLDSDEPS